MSSPISVTEPEGWRGRQVEPPGRYLAGVGSDRCGVDAVVPAPPPPHPASADVTTTQTITFEVRIDAS
jgi:hypothetical protein